eukprot:gene12363-26009_t
MLCFLFPEKNAPSNLYFGTPAFMWKMEIRSDHIFYITFEVIVRHDFEEAKSSYSVEDLIYIFCFRDSWWRVTIDDKCIIAAENGHLELSSLLLEEQYRTSLHFVGCYWDYWTFIAAAKNGHMNILKWLRSKFPPFEWDRWIGSAVSSHGQLDMLKLLRSQDPSCPWNLETFIEAADSEEKEH